MEPTRRSNRLLNKNINYSEDTPPPMPPYILKAVHVSRRELIELDSWEPSEILESNYIGKKLSFKVKLTNRDKNNSTSKSKLIYEKRPN